MGNGTSNTFPGGIYATGGGSYLTATEEWIGAGAGVFAWTTVNSMNTGRQSLAGSGTADAALAFGGETPAPAATGKTESFDGTNWTEVADLNTGRYRLSGFGTQTASIAAGGDPGSPDQSALVEIWNGSAWA